MSVRRRLHRSGNLLLQDVIHCAEDCALGQASCSGIPTGALAVIHPASSDRRQNIMDILLHLTGAHSTAGRRHLLLPYRFLGNRRLRGELNTLATAQSRGTSSRQRCHLGLLNLDAAFTAFANAGRTYLRCVTLLLRNGLLLLQTLLGLRRQVILQSLQQR